MKNVEKIDDSRAVGMTEYLRAADAAKNAGGECRRCAAVGRGCAAVKAS
ncbi:MAG: hypothetical protein IKI77_07485 [Oscillospiraceae bacterium]|nr:hypothetical protein [Oscillospiraceae bacterium]